MKTYVLAIALLTGNMVNAQDSIPKKDTTSPFNQRLKEITITARRPLMTMEADKTIIDVKAMTAGAANNTFELLEKIPGVNINSNGDISLNGRSGVLVLIDGRATYMSAPDLAAYLKSIPSANLDKIELIDNPSSKYDAAGNAIINIRMRKNRNAGFTGSVNSGISQGRYFRSSNSVNLNFSRNKLNIFSNIGLYTAKEYNTELFDRKYYDASNNIESSILLENNQVSDGKNINIYSGFDYFISPKTTVGANVGYNEGARTTHFDYTGKGSSNFGTGTNLSEDDRHSVNVNLNMLHQFNKDGHELSADVNYLKYGSDNSRLQQNLLYDYNNALINDESFQYVVPVTSSIYVFKADYVRPWNKKLRLEAGIKSSLIANDNVSDYYNRKATPPQYVAANSNHFKYDENINAAYANLQKSWSRWQAQFGLRVENMQATGNQLGNESVQQSKFKKSNTELFPSAFVLYKLDSMGKNSLSLLMTRRINRPNYFQLNPFVFVKDEYTNVTGNPNLNPQFQYRLEAKYQHKQRYWFALSYNRFTQVLFNITQVVGEKYINRPENISKGFMVILNSGLNTSPAKWWTLNYVLRFSRLGLRATVYDQDVSPQALVVRFESLNFFTISKTISAELGGYYASKDINGQSITKQMFRVAGSIQKKIMRDRGSIRLGVEDLFHTWKYRNTSVGLKQSSFYQTSESDTQRFVAGFSYRFGKDSNNRKRRQSNANDEEKGRLE
jgi:hypothetical protein